MKYCSECGSVNIVSQIPDLDNRLRHVCGECSVIHYQNPKIITGCIALWEGKILLCRRAIEPRKGFWNLPAGFMENDETPAQGAIREVMEESGAEVDIVGLHSVYAVLHANQIYMMFLAKLRSPQFLESPETLESRLFAPEDIPWEEIAFFSNRFGLKHYLAAPDFAGVHLGDSVSFK
jgi:ADP-ribose pyrophosphatase YjhB (NUDIX family)